MASILSRNGRRSVQFYDAAGKRRTVALGKVSQKQADFVKTKIEALAASCITGHAPDDEVSRWLAKRDTVMLEKLAAVGLVARRESATLGKFLDEFTASRIDVKPATREIWSQPVRNLKDFFGVDRPLRAITGGDAENFRLFLVGEKLASTTVQKRLQFARQFFRSACRHKLIQENPFAEVRSNAGSDSDRQHFITHEEAGKLVEACPNIDWRLIVALSRFGGLRCPSEVLSLRWQDIDWATGRVLVTSPKTEHHPGKDTRLIPLFPELLPILEEAFEAAPEGAVFVVNEKYRKAAMGPRGWRGCNLRTTMGKVIRRAGLSPWPRMFHNLRSSRETELAERFPIHVVTSWLGNTPDIAQKHYLQTTDEHFRQAAALQPALRQPSEIPRRSQQEPIPAATAGNGEQDPNARPCQGFQGPAKACAAVVSPYVETRNGEDRIRTCGPVARSRI